MLIDTIANINSSSVDEENNSCNIQTCHKVLKGIISDKDFEIDKLEKELCKTQEERDYLFGIVSYINSNFQQQIKTIEQQKSYLQELSFPFAVQYIKENSDADYNKHVHQQQDHHHHIKQTECDNTCIEIISNSNDGSDNGNEECNINQVDKEVDQYDMVTKSLNYFKNHIEYLNETILIYNKMLVLKSIDGKIIQERREMGRCLNCGVNNHTFIQCQSETCYHRVNEHGTLINESFHTLIKAVEDSVKSVNINIKTISECLLIKIQQEQPQQQPSNTVTTDLNTLISTEENKQITEVLDSLLKQRRVINQTVNLLKLNIENLPLQQQQQQQTIVDSTDNSSVVQVQSLQSSVSPTKTTAATEQFDQVLPSLAEISEIASTLTNIICDAPKQPLTGVKREFMDDKNNRDYMKQQRIIQNLEDGEIFYQRVTNNNHKKKKTTNNNNNNKPTVATPKSPKQPAKSNKIDNTPIEIE